MNPSEASPVYSFLRSPSMVDFQGHLAVVTFVSGCNFKCGFCHNAPLMRDRQKGVPWGRLDKACGKFVSDWVDGVVISGGEPTLSPGLPGLIEYFKKLGWAVKLDTNGSKPDVLRQCLPQVDYVAMDIKTGLSGYPELTGYDDVDNIRESIELIKGGSTDYEFRTTVIESVHDDSAVMEMGDIIKGAKRYFVQAFLPRDELPSAEFRKMTRTSPDRLKEIAEMLKDCAEEVSVRGEM